MKDLMEQTVDSIKHISDSRARSQANISISNKNMELADVIFARGWDDMAVERGDVR
jgi:cyanophycinase-like exopeptidase